MTAISPERARVKEDTSEVTDDTETETEAEEYQPNTCFYVEKDTRLIYEVQFFQDFVLVQPASPAFSSALRQLTVAEFTDEFEEFWGDQKYLRDVLSGKDQSLGVE